MKSIAVFLLIGCAYGIPEIWFPDTSLRILKGKNASDGEFPFAVSIRRKQDNLHACGGTILTKNWVLTTAHCCKRVAAEDMSVYVGSVYLDKGGKYHPGEKSVIHEKYDAEDAWKNDICVVKVKTPFTLAGNVQQVTLPPQFWPVAPGSNLTACGWGYTTILAGQKPLPNRLQKADTFVAVSNEQCFDETFTDMTPGYLCARGGVRGQGICNGDSGSPLLKNNVQVGIASWVYMPCGGGKPDFFTRVPYYINWLKKNLGADASQLKFTK